MGLAVVGAGLGRTGTMSLKLALEQLGFGPCHHMEEVLKNRDQLAFWQAAAAGETVDWDAVFAGYRSTVDWPSARFWQEIAAFYPEAKVVLSTRPPERWWASFSKTIKPLLAMRQEIPDPYVRAVMAMGETIITEQTFGETLDDEAAAIAVYKAHVARVQSSIAPERLLTFDVAQGWAPLCAFLGKPVPDGPFPRTNSSEEFWELVKKAGQESA